MKRRRRLKKKPRSDRLASEAKPMKSRIDYRKRNLPRRLRHGSERARRRNTNKKANAAAAGGPGIRVILFVDREVQ